MGEIAPTPFFNFTTATFNSYGQWWYNQTNTFNFTLATFNSYGYQWYNYTLSAINTFGTWGTNATTLHISNITGVINTTVCSGTDKLNQINFTNGVLVGGCTADESGGGGGVSSHFPFDFGSVFGYVRPAGFATTFTAVGMETPIAFGTPTATNDDQSFPSMSIYGQSYFIKYTTTAAKTNTTAGIWFLNETKFTYYPRIRTQVFTDNNQNNSRIWFALETGGTVNLTTSNGTGGSGYTPEYMGIAWSNVSAPKTRADTNPNWKCCSGNGTAGSCIDMGLEMHSNQSYMLDLEVINLTMITCRIADNITWYETNKSDLLPVVDKQTRFSIRNTMTMEGLSPARSYYIAWTYLRT